MFVEFAKDWCQNVELVSYQNQQASGFAEFVLSLNNFRGSMIRIEKLTKQFGQLVAVNQLDLEVKQGETLGLLGPNGAGKTTAISMMVGLLRPDSGSVCVGDKGGISGDPTQPAIRKLIGVAPQSLALYEELTARENLQFFGRLYGLAGAKLKKRTEWALDFSKLQDRKNDRVGEFSGGMKRRLNIAVGLIHEPQILLLDEPTVGVDPQSRNHIFECIEQLHDAGLTLIYTTHYMEEAQRLCDRVAIMDHGRLLALDTVEGLIATQGGASVVEAELKPGIGHENVPAGLGTVIDHCLRFESERPLDEIANLTSNGVQFQTLKISQPDLESVFLTLTGRSLRE